MKFFLDTYALVEIEKGNAKYAPYRADAGTGPGNLLEYHFVVARDHGDEVADEGVAALRSAMITIEVDDIRAASRIRRQERARNLSFVDALGYAMARNRGLRFVTGDKGFRGLEGVETPA